MGAFVVPFKLISALWMAIKYGNFHHDGFLLSSRIIVTLPPDFTDIAHMGL
jgi:hypothetical protein